MTLVFQSKDQALLIEHGKLADERSRNFIKDSLGVTEKKVEATRHSILSGDPGVGKSYGTAEECQNAGVKYLVIPPGISDIALTIKLAWGVYNLKDEEELVVILDDADDVVFGNYSTLNKWKIAMSDTDYDMGLIPTFNHPVSMTGTMAGLVKAGKDELVEALQNFQSIDEVGVTIPMDRVRFVILCNVDFEDPKAFSRNAKLKSAIAPVLDRVNYKRINMDWEKQWGWLAYVLGMSQPFKEYPLSDEAKVKLLEWMYSNWTNLRSTSYRTVEKLAEDMINYPDSYKDQWSEKLKGH